MKLCFTKYFVTLPLVLVVVSMSSNQMFLLPANEVWGKVIFLHLSVILFTWGEYLGRYPPSGRYTPGRYTPLGRYPNPLAGTPPAMHAGIWSTSGRYASYWNAFLLDMKLFCVMYYAIEIGAMLLSAIKFRQRLKIVSFITYHSTKKCEEEEETEDVCTASVVQWSVKIIVISSAGVSWVLQLKKTVGKKLNWRNFTGGSLSLGHLGNSQPNTRCFRDGLRGQNFMSKKMAWISRS